MVVCALDQGGVRCSLYGNYKRRPTSKQGGDGWWEVLPLKPHNSGEHHIVFSLKAGLPHLCVSGAVETKCPAARSGCPTRPQDPPSSGGPPKRKAARPRIRPPTLSPSRAPDGRPCLDGPWSVRSIDTSTAVALTLPPSAASPAEMVGHPLALYWWTGVTDIGTLAHLLKLESSGCVLSTLRIGRL